MNQKEIEKKLEAYKKALHRHAHLADITNNDGIEVFHFQVYGFHKLTEAFKDLENEITKTTRPRRFRVRDYQIVNRFGDDDEIMRAGFRWDSGEWTLTLGPNDVVNAEYIGISRSSGWNRYYEWIQLSDVEEIYP